MRGLVQCVARRRDAYPRPRRDLPQGQRAVPLRSLAASATIRNTASSPVVNWLASCGGMGPDAASVRRRLIDARRFGDLAAFRLGGKWLGRPCLAGSLDHLRRADRYGVDPSHLPLAGLHRLRQRARLLVGEPPCSPVAPNGPGEPVEGGKRFRPANRGQ